MNQLCENQYVALLCEPVGNIVDWPWWKILAFFYGIILFLKVLRLLPTVLAIIPDFVLRKSREAEERRRQARHATTPPI